MTFLKINLVKMAWFFLITGLLSIGHTLGQFPAFADYHNQVPLNFAVAQRIVPAFALYQAPPPATNIRGPWIAPDRLDLHVDFPEFSDENAAGSAGGNEGILNKANGEAGIIIRLVESTRGLGLQPPKSPRSPELLREESYLAERNGIADDEHSVAVFELKTKRAIASAKFRIASRKIRAEAAKKDNSGSDGQLPEALGEDSYLTEWRGILNDETRLSLFERDSKVAVSKANFRISQRKSRLWYAETSKLTYVTDGPYQSLVDHIEADPPKSADAIDTAHAETQSPQDEDDGMDNRMVPAFFQQRAAQKVRDATQN